MKVYERSYQAGDTATNVLKLYEGGFFLKLYPEGVKSTVFCALFVTVTCGVQSSVRSILDLFTPAGRSVVKREFAHETSSRPALESKVMIHM